MFDEPVNGLDPEGIIWIRTLHPLFGRGGGRTVLVSSHLMSEMALTADHLLVIGRGRMIADMPLADADGPVTPAIGSRSGPPTRSGWPRTCATPAPRSRSSRTGRSGVVGLGSRKIGDAGR